MYVCILYKVCQYVGMRSVQSISHLRQGKEQLNLGIPTLDYFKLCPLSLYTLSSEVFVLMETFQKVLFLNGFQLCLRNRHEILSGLTSGSFQRHLQLIEQPQIIISHFWTVGSLVNLSLRTPGSGAKRGMGVVVMQLLTY